MITEQDLQIAIEREEKKRMKLKDDFETMQWMRDDACNTAYELITDDMKRTSASIAGREKEIHDARKQLNISI